MKDSKKQIVQKALSSVKMHDMGHKMEDSCCTPMNSKEMKSKKYYPTIYLDSKEASFLKNHNVGEKKRFIIDAIIKSKTLRDNESTGESASFDLKIQSMGVEEK